MLERAAPLPALLYVHDVGGVELAAAVGPSLAGLAAVSDFLTAEIRAHGGEAVTVPPIVPRASYRVDSSRSSRCSSTRSRRRGSTPCSRWPVPGPM